MVSIAVGPKTKAPMNKYRNSKSRRNWGRKSPPRRRRSPRMYLKNVFKLFKLNMIIIRLNQVTVAENAYREDREHAVVQTVDQEEDNRNL